MFSPANNALAISILFKKILSDLPTSVAFFNASSRSYFTSNTSKLVVFSTFPDLNVISLSLLYSIIFVILSFASCCVNPDTSMPFILMPLWLMASVGRY